MLLQTRMSLVALAEYFLSLSVHAFGFAVFRVKSPHSHLGDSDTACLASDDLIAFGLRGRRLGSKQFGDLLRNEVVATDTQGHN